MKKTRAHIFISGDVTGVGYRYWAYDNAQRLGLLGYVRNLNRGQVEAVFEGEEEKVLEMIEKCKKGPEVAWVEKVDVSWEEATGEFINFEISY